MTVTNTHAEIPDAGTARSKALWAGVIAAPLLWFVHLTVDYALVPLVCHTQKYVIMHGVTALFFVAALVCGWMSWADYRAAGSGSPDATDGGPVARQRFLGALGTLVSSLAAVSIFAQGVAAFFLNACWT